MRGRRGEGRREGSRGVGEGEGRRRGRGRGANEGGEQREADTEIHQVLLVTLWVHPLPCCNTQLLIPHSSLWAC